jgi:hypothetical protein
MNVMNSKPTKYKITGRDARGRRFCIRTNSAAYAEGINAFSGTLWEHDGVSYRRVKTYM